ncbi:ABC transporter permease [uncultured Paludibaculum sp.]|uniref:ABC transporter permease n=1 Tax=uncultured Paludibaculum sp. TaxID=1765020 RepID=UPI002AAA7BF3|nr:ABC transporter permease [uncultured Paludibaculum sp.]
MRLLRKLGLRVRSVLFRGRVDRELQGELLFHLEQLTQENIEAGMSPEEALDSARRSMGGIAQTEEECRDTRGVGFLIDIARDLRLGLRTLGRVPVFVLTIVVTLGLGIGANTAIFSISDALLFKSLPVAEPQRLFQLLQPDGPGLREYGELFSPSDFRDMREGVTRFAQLGAATQVREVPATLEGTAEEPVRRGIISGNLFRVIGIGSTIGRTITDADVRATGGHPIAVISHAFWKRRFNADSRVLGRTIRIGGGLFEIIGVAQPGFWGIDVGTMTDVWTPLTAEPQQGASLRLIGRLSPGASLEQAAAPMQVIYHRHMAEMVGHAPPGTSRGLIDHILGLKIQAVPAARGISELRTTYRKPLLVVFGLVGLVLLAACITVTTLMEARHSVRAREMAVRTSLGASRWRLMRQLLCEGLLVVSAAGTAGLSLAHWTTPLIVKLLAPSQVPVQLPTVVDGRVLAFTTCISALTLLVFGLVPAWRSSKVDIAASLKAGAGRMSVVRRSRTSALIASQAAMSLVLVMGATVFVRTLVNLSNVDAGLDRKNVIVANVQFRGPDRGARLALAWEDLRRRVSEIPGIEAASLSSGSAFDGAFGNGMIRLPSQPAGTRNGCLFFHASTGFFRTSGMALLEGRDFEPRDFEAAAPPVAILSESAVRRFFPETNPIGRVFSNFEDNPPRWVTVIGVAGDTRFESLRNPPPVAAYLPYTWPRPASAMALVLGTHLDAASLAASLRDAAKSSNAGFVLRQTTSQSELIDRTLMRERQMAMVASFFGVLALMMAAVGLYGTVSYTTEQRTREIGIRMALGAAPSTVAGMILHESGMAVAIGAVVGLAIGQGLGKLVTALLFGAQPYDPVTIAVSLSVLLAVTLGAASVPALRTARVDPTTALRQE